MFTASRIMPKHVMQIAYLGKVLRIIVSNGHAHVNKYEAVSHGCSFSLHKATFTLAKPLHNAEITIFKANSFILHICIP
jgi:hypothetical protein